MSPLFGILFVILLVRWVLPTLWTYLSQPNSEFEWGKRGRVAGHRGPRASSFKGRAGRREWWLTMLGITIISVVIGAIPTFGPLLTLPWVIMTLALNARRLHDLSMSAWVQVAPLVFGVVYGVLYFMAGQPDPLVQASLDISTITGRVTIAGIAWVVAYLIFYAVVGFVRGTRGPNAYGEADPA